MTHEYEEAARSIVIYSLEREGFGPFSKNVPYIELAEIIRRLPGVVWRAPITTKDDAANLIVAAATVGVDAIMARKNKISPALDKACR